MIIEDGQGSGKLAKVNDENRVATAAVARSDINEAIINSEAFFLNTPIITLTSGTASAVFFIKNLGETDIYLQEILISIGESTGGPGGAVLVSGHRNPADTETIVTGGTTQVHTCQNFGSSRQADVSAFYGAEGLSAGAANSGVLVKTLTQFDTAASRILIPQGSSYALSVTPPTGNTSMPVTVRVLFAEIGGDF